MSTKEPAFIIDEHNIFLSKIYKKDNYKEIIIDKEKGFVIYFFLEMEYIFLTRKKHLQKQ